MAETFSDLFRSIVVHMKRLLFFIALGAFLFEGKSQQMQAQVAPALNWNTDITVAQQLSNTQNKPIFAFFTGSDWCGWCHKIQRNVFAKPEFHKWAKDNVVLLELDYPKYKQLPATLAQQNNELRQVFQVNGFPTVWMFYLTHNDSTNRMNITPLGQLGYPQGGEPGREEVVFLRQANDALKNKPANAVK
jgi:protein disulfide-isomerase